VRCSRPGVRRTPGPPGSSSRPRVVQAGPRQRTPRAVTVLDARGDDTDGREQAEGVGDDEPLAALDLLACPRRSPWPRRERCQPCARTASRSARRSVQGRVLRRRAPGPRLAQPTAVLPTDPTRLTLRQDWRRTSVTMDTVYALRVGTKRRPSRLTSAEAAGQARSPARRLIPHPAPAKTGRVDLPKLGRTVKQQVIPPLRQASESPRTRHATSSGTGGWPSSPCIGAGPNDFVSGGRG
jgi:hypothetical protein